MYSVLLLASFLAPLNLISASEIVVPRTVEEAKNELSHYHYADSIQKKAHLEKILDRYPALVPYAWNNNCMSDSPEIVDLLIKRGSDVNCFVFGGVPLLIQILSDLNDPCDEHTSGNWAPGPSFMLFNRFLEEWIDFEVKDSQGQTLEEIANAQLHQKYWWVNDQKYYTLKWQTAIAALRARKEKQESIRGPFALILSDLCWLNKQALGAVTASYLDDKDIFALFSKSRIPLNNTEETLIAIRKAIDASPNCLLPKNLLETANGKQDAVLWDKSTHE